MMGFYFEVQPWIDKEQERERFIKMMVDYKRDMVIRDFLKNLKFHVVRRSPFQRICDFISGKRHCREFVLLIGGCSHEC